MIILGIDPSLTGLGLATFDAVSGAYSARTAAYVPHRGETLDPHKRLAWLAGQVENASRGAAVAVVEGPSYGSTAGQRGHHERAGLWWMITHDLWEVGLPVVVVPPASLKLYATGKGNSAKDAVMLATGRAFAAFQGDNNAADSLWLAAMGSDRYGRFRVAMGEDRRKRALDACVWPALAIGGA